MAYRKCRDCGQMVSINAVACPSCGNAAVNHDFTVFANIVALSKKTLKMFIKIAIVFVIIGLISISSGELGVMAIGAVFILLAIGLVALGSIKVKNAKDKQKEYLEKVIIK